MTPRQSPPGLPEGHSPTGWQALFVGRNGALSLALSGGLVVHAVSVFVVATILPAIVADIGGLAYYAWTSMLFVIGSIIGSVVAPWMLTRRGSRLAYRVALALFVAGSFVCAVAPAMWVLLVGRLLQGFGGGMLPALAYTMIRRLFPETLWPRAISMLSGVWGIAALAGPFVGGIFAGLDAWRLAFLVNVPLGLAFAVVAQRVLPGGDRIDARPDLPVARLALFAAAVAALASAGVAGSGWLSAGAVAAAAVLLACFLRLDHRSAARLLPVGAFDPRTGLGAVSLTMTLLASGTCATAFIPYLLQVGSGFDAMAGGYMAAVQSLSWTAAALMTASAVGAAAWRVMAVGPAVMLAGTATMAWALSTGSILPVAVALILIGGGIGMSWSHLGTRMIAAAPVSERDVASSFIATTQQTAIAFGSAFAGIVANAAGLATATTPAQVIHAGSWLFLAFCIAPCIALANTRRMLRAIAKA